MKRSRRTKNKDKTSLSHAVMSSIQLPLDLLIKSKQVHAGLLACMALGAGGGESGLRAASSNDQDNQVSIASNQFNGNSEKDASAEVDNLRKQLQSATRKLKEYQAHLFRSSHPKDQAKIAELNRAVVEKEKLNSQLSASLKSLEDELASTRKQIANLEVTSDALNSLLRTHRTSAESESKNLHGQLDQLAQSYDADKQALIAQVGAYEAEQQRLLKVLEGKNKTLNQLGDTIAMNNTWSAQLLKDMQELKNIYDVALQNHQNELAAQAHTLFEELLALDITFAISQRVAAEGTQKLSMLMENERQITEKLNDELLAARHSIASHEAHILELENNSQKALALASDLTVQLGESQANHSMTQNELAAAFRQLEDTKTSLLNELQVSKEELETKLSEIGSLELQVGDMVAALETQHQHTLALGQRLIQSMRDNAAASTLIEEYRTLAGQDHATASALKDALYEQTAANAILEEQSVGTISQLAAATSYGNNLEQALQMAAKEKDHLQAKLHHSGEETNALKEKISSLAARIDNLEKEKNQLSLQIDDHRQVIAHHEAHKETLSNSLLDSEDALSSAHSHYQATIDDIGLQVEELEAKLKIEEERSVFLQTQLETALAGMESDEQRHQVLDEMTEEIVNLKLKIVFSEQLSKRLAEASSILESRHQSEIDKIHALLDERDSTAAELREEILVLSQKRADEEQYRAELENSARDLARLLEANEKMLQGEAGNSAALKEQLAILEQERMRFSKLEAELAGRHALVEALHQQLQEIALQQELENQQADNLHNKVRDLTLLLEHKEHAVGALEEAVTSSKDHIAKMEHELEKSHQNITSLERFAAEQEAAFTAHQLALSSDREKLEAELSAHHSEREKAQQSLRDIAAQHADELRRTSDLNEKIKELATLLEYKEASLASLEGAFEALTLKTQKLAIEQEESRRHEMERDSSLSEIAKSVDEKTQALNLAYSSMFVANQLNQKLQEENKRLAAELKRHKDEKLYSSSSFLPILKTPDSSEEAALLNHHHQADIAN